MILTIDPGLSISPGGTGWAVFDSKLHNLKPIATGIATTRQSRWQDRCEDVCGKLLEEVDGPFFGTTKDKSFSVLIELPTMFQTAKGMTCATGKDGGDSDLVKLSFLVGMLYSTFSTIDTVVTLVRVNEWKGTLPKEVVANRVADRLGYESVESMPFKSHAIDAIGIGLWAKGVFKANANK